MYKEKMEGIPYKAVVRSSIYAMWGIKANFACAVSTMSQFMSRTSPPYWMAVKHIMRHLKGTLYSKLYLGYKNIALKRFCDANWVGDAKCLEIHHMIYVLCECWRYLMEIQETTNHCTIYNGGRVDGH